MPAPAVVQTPASRTAPRTSLRVGIMQARRIVEERVLERASEVSIGTAPSSTFIVPAEEQLPARWRLFDRRGERWVLWLAAGMVAQVAAEGRVATFRGGGDQP